MDKLRELIEQRDKLYETMKAEWSKATAKEDGPGEADRRAFDRRKSEVENLDRAIAALKMELGEREFVPVDATGGIRTRREDDDGGFTGGIGEMLQSLYRTASGRGFDNRLAKLEVRASINEGVDAEGGFFVPVQFVIRALTNDLQDTVLLQLCDRQPMTSETCSIPAFADDDHNSSAPYGIDWSQLAEGASLGTAQGVTVKSLKLRANKSGALFYLSNEWLSDTGAAVRERLDDVFRSSLRWYIESLLWNGTGAGEPLGALVGPGTLEISKESGQAADTVITENIVNMWARLRPGSHGRAIWVANQTCFPMLSTLYISVGTGGAPVSLLQTNVGAGVAGAPANSMLGRPLYFSEHLPVLGDAGDIVLCDPKLYTLGDRQQITLDISKHYRFGNDQTAFKGIARLDGQPQLSSTFTPANGDTCGWAVKIEARA